MMRPDPGHPPMMRPDPGYPPMVRPDPGYPPMMRPTLATPKRCKLAAVARHHELRPAHLFFMWLHVDGKVKTRALE